MKLDKLTSPLIVINLTLLAIHFFIRLPLVNKIFSCVFKLIIVPILISIFIFYLLKPLNNRFVKKGLQKNKAPILTIIIGVVIVFGVVEGLGYYFIAQFNTLVTKLIMIEHKNNVLSYINGNIAKYINIKWLFEQTLTAIKNYISYFTSSVVKTASYVFNLFSDILLILLIVFYLLKDEERLRYTLLKLVPSKYKNRYKDKLNETLLQCDDVLSNYVVGQAKVALSLSSMVYAGYLIIGMPSGLILASITLILAFIPFIGFFISMVIPYIIAVSMGFKMVIKLSILFIIAQTLKGRLVVPFVMSKAMKIHPLTDIFLVISAASILGPIGAFIIVPVYAVIKVALINLKPKNKIDS